MTAKEWLCQYPALRERYYCMQHREKDSEMVAVVRQQLTDIENAIFAVKNPACSEVLRLRYTDGPAGRLLPWKDVAFAMYQNDTEADLLRINRLHRKALAMVKMPNA